METSLTTLGHGGHWPSSDRRRAVAQGGGRPTATGSPTPSAPQARPTSRKRRQHLFPRIASCALVLPLDPRTRLRQRRLQLRRFGSRARCAAEPAFGEWDFLHHPCVHGLVTGRRFKPVTTYPQPFGLPRFAMRWTRSLCTGGVFMENGSTVYGLRSQWLRSSPAHPCQRVGLRYRASCDQGHNAHSERTTSTVRHGCKSPVPRLHTTGSATASCLTTARDARPSRWEGRTDFFWLAGLLCSPGDCLYGAARTIAHRDAKGQGAAAFCRGQPKVAARPARSEDQASPLGSARADRQNTTDRPGRRLSGESVRECREAAIRGFYAAGRGAWG